LRLTLPVLAIFASIFIWSPPTTAHKTRVQRKALVTVRPDVGGVTPEMMIWMRMGGARAKRFIRQFDINQDGELGQREGQQLADALSAEAIGGVYLSLNEESLPPLKAVSKAKVIAQNTIEVAILLSYGPRPLAAGALTIGARVGRDRPGAHPHLAEIGVIDPLWIRTATQRVRRLGPQKIKPKSPWQIMVTRPRPTAGQPAVTP
jgi:hypothetical protein